MRYRVQPMPNCVDISDINRCSKNRNLLQFRILGIKFLNSKLNLTFWISANVTISTIQQKWPISDLPILCKLISDLRFRSDFYRTSMQRQWVKSEDCITSMYTVAAATCAFKEVGRFQSGPLTASGHDTRG